ncbi:MAG: 16S rRNA (cytosine(1402)-N(4))-methyltransferase RsmH [Desulfocapsaceae bacterium]|nr:16S rRNA (cytosine(1402)-N(4))-methyltransferase RsmH [Desulfocapsaceae bacterium]
MMSAAADIHIPVLADEVIKYLQPCSDGIYVDGTLGLGGHSEAILKASAPTGRLIGFEWDNNAIQHAKQRLKPFGERVVIVRRNFAELCEGLAEIGVDRIDGLLVDVGISSLQLDQGERGFSFLRDEPLDMRMDTRRQTTAAKLIQNGTAEELADIIFYYGEEKQARRIAAAIVKARKKKAIARSKQLVEIIVKAVPRRFHPKKIHVATKTFQGLRIAVNRELENLARLIDDAVRVLKPGGRICVIAFHSLEDRIVKQKLNEMDVLNVITKKPVVASQKEVEANPRARSAKLRVAEIAA